MVQAESLRKSKSVDTSTVKPLARSRMMAERLVAPSFIPQDSVLLRIGEAFRKLYHALDLDADLQTVLKHRIAGHHHSPSRESVPNILA